MRRGDPQSQVRQRVLGYGKKAEFFFFFLFSFLLKGTTKMKTSEANHSGVIAPDSGDRDRITGSLRPAQFTRKVPHQPDLPRELLFQKQSKTKQTKQNPHQNKIHYIYFKIYCKN